MQDYSIDLTKTVKTIIPAMKNGMDSTASNFSGTSAPTAQFVGQQYYNSTDKTMYTCTDVENNTWTDLLGDAKKAMLLAASSYLQRSTNYSAGDIIPAADNLSKAYALLCTGSTTTGTTIGTTGTASPTSWAAVGATTTDGTAVFTTIPKRPTTLATSGITDAIANTGSTAISFAINATDGGLDAVIG